ncbi:MAG: glutamate--tRNA ligase, partial [Paludibacter sp.]|nr:glutamate--tRNA ligase [Paludibacter sp.]
EKGKWFNHKYLQSKSLEEITDLFQHILIEKDIVEDTEKIMKIVELVRERANFVNELWSQSSFLFVAPTTYDEKTVQKRWKAETPLLMQELIETLETIDDFTAEKAEEIVKEWIAAKAYNMGGVMNAFRLAIVGEAKGPHIFDIISLIGKDETIKRLLKAIEMLG